MAKLYRTLVDENGVAIDDLNGDWTSKAYPMGENTHLCVHLFWNDPAVTGVLYLDYSGDPCEDGTPVVDDWVEYSAVNLDGTFPRTMFLDADLAAMSFRLRFEHAAGTATLGSYIARKRR